MRLLSLVSVTLYLSSVSAGQIPVVNGVLGGVPSTAGSTFKSAPFKTVPSTPGALRITENSGICETTSGVYQASGYGDITATKSIWFWFFAARNNPSTAPVAIWFNGGPGASSMLGLFRENGPCRINNVTSTVSNNPYSWNNNVNMLYIDQPAGVGFSHGDINIGTSQDAAVDIWQFLQIFFQDSRFSQYQPRNLGLWTESYGGHYGPIFVNYFLQQNAAIAANTVTGVTLNIKMLGIGNGLTDVLTQYPYNLAYSSYNPYVRPSLASTSVNIAASNAWNNGCSSKIIDCYNGGSDAVCSDAQQFCHENFFSPLTGTTYDPYFIASTLPNPYPPSITSYLSSIRSTIGAEANWDESNLDVYSKFALTGDWMRNARPALEAVITAGVRTIFYAGEADYTGNPWGFEQMVKSLNTPHQATYLAQGGSPYTVGGQGVGNYKNAGKISFVNFIGTGLEVGAYLYGTTAHGQMASQIFNQIMQDQPLTPG